MVHMRCQHLQSEIRHNIHQRILQQWRLFILNCQTRQASTLLTRSNKSTSPNLMNELDSLEHLHQIKSIAKKRIPVHISSKVDKQLVSPSTMTVQAYLQKGKIDSAWEMIDKSASSLTQESIPRLTAHLLLESLHSQININLNRLTLDSAKFQKLYFYRLELLAGAVRRNNGDLGWNNAEFGMVLESYGKLDQVKRAESLFRNMLYYTSPSEFVVNSEVYSQMAAVYVRRFKYTDDATKKRYFSKLKTLEQEMVRKGLQPDTAFFNMLLAAKIKLHDLQGAENIYSKMTAVPDRTTYNILLNGYLKNCSSAKDREITQQWLERLISSGITPNRKTFNSVMEGLVFQVVRHARMKDTREMFIAAQSISKLYKAMLEVGHRPDTEIINTLLRCYTATNDIDQIEKIIGMLILPEKKGGCGGNCSCASKATAADPKPKPKFKVKPDSYTFNILIKYHLDKNNTELAFQMYDTMVNLDLHPDTVTYGNFIWFYAHQGNVKEAIKYIDVMHHKGIPCNNYIYNTLLDCSLKYPKESHLITPHLRAMIANGSSTLDSVSMNIPIARFQCTGDSDSLESDFARYADMLESVYTTPDLNIRTYNTVLQSAGKFYRAKNEEVGITLDSILSALDTSYMTPDLYTFALGIRNAAYTGDMVKADSIYKKMIDSGVKPNRFVFSHLIYGYASIGKVDKAHELLAHMDNYKLKPTALHYAPLIKGFAESAEYDKAYDLFRSMLEKNVNADLVIYTILASVFLESPVQGNGRRAIDLLEGIEKAGITMDAVSLTLLAKAYAIEGSTRDSSVYVQKIDKIYQTLKSNKWLDAKAITTLLTAHYRLQNPDAAWELWNTLKKEEAVLSIPHYNALMLSLSLSKTWYPAAKMIFDEMLQNPKISPDVQTYDLILWNAYAVSDQAMIRKIWYSRKDKDALMARSYFAVMKAMLDKDDIAEAQRVYCEFRKVPFTPDSATLWTTSINKLATHQGFIQDLSKGDDSAA